MKKIILLFLVCFLLFAACENKEKTTNEDPEEYISNELSNSDLSYAFGVSIGSSLQNYIDEMDYAEFIKGMKDVMEEGGNPRYSVSEVNQKINETLQIQQERKAAVSLEEGKAFLEENKSKKGVITTASGLQYEILKEGSGDKPLLTDQVEVHYVGTLLDGTEFDSSISRGEPVQFSLQGVIPGWTEGLQLMNVGSKYKFYIPFDLAYGERGSQNIGPNETLIFEVELLSIVEKPAPDVTDLD